MRNSADARASGPCASVSDGRSGRRSQRGGQHAHGDRTEHVNTIVIGAGQAGLSVGYHLKRRGVPFLILDAGTRRATSGGQRWDSLRLFTPARYAGLDGMPFPAPPHAFPTKDEMGDFLEHYARRFALPVRTGVRVDRVSRQGDGFLAVPAPAGSRRTT